MNRTGGVKNEGPAEGVVHGKEEVVHGMRLIVANDSGSLSPVLVLGGERVGVRGNAVPSMRTDRQFAIFNLLHFSIFNAFHFQCRSSEARALKIAK